MERVSKAMSNRSPTDVPVKTVLDFASIFTSSRNDGRLDELLVEREVAVVENDGKTTPVFSMINKSDIRKISPVLAEIDDTAPLNCLVFLKASEGNL